MTDKIPGGIYLGTDGTLHDANGKSIQIEPIAEEVQSTPVVADIKQPVSAPAVPKKRK